MKTILTLTFAALTLSACGLAQRAPVAAPPSPLDLNRAAAQAVVGPIVAQTVPGPAGAVLAECIILNATSSELVRLAAQGASPENTALVSDILSRPDTVNCATSALT